MERVVSNYIGKYKFIFQYVKNLSKKFELNRNISKKALYNMLFYLYCKKLLNIYYIT